MRGGRPAASQLRLQDLLPHAVDRYPVERLGHRRQRADHVELAGAPALHAARTRCPCRSTRRSALSAAAVQLIGAPADRAGAARRRRCLAAGAGAATGSSLSAPILRSAASAARSPLSQAPSTVPHSVSWVASPAKNMQPTGSVRIFRDGCAAGRGHRHRAERERRRIPAGRARFLHRGRGIAAEQFGQPFHGEGDHRLFALRGEIAAERARDIDRAQRRSRRYWRTAAPFASNCSAR